MTAHLTMALATITPVLLISGLIRPWWTSPWKPGACFLSNALATNTTLKAKVSCVSDSSFPPLIRKKQNDNKKHELPAYAVFSMMWEGIKSHHSKV